MPITNSAGIALEGVAPTGTATNAPIPRTVPPGGFMDTSGSNPFGGTAALDLLFIPQTVFTNVAGLMSVTNPSGWNFGTANGAVAGGLPKTWRLLSRVANGGSLDIPRLSYTSTTTFGSARLRSSALRWALRGATGHVFQGSGRLHSVASTDVTAAATVTIPNSTVIVSMAASNITSIPTLATANGFVIPTGGSYLPTDGNDAPYALAWQYYATGGTVNLPRWHASVDIPGNPARDPAGWIAYSIVLPSPGGFGFGLRFGAPGGFN